MVKLTKKQDLFINHYLFGDKPFNATQAARNSGYSEKTAFIIGYENLKKPYIKEEINRRMQKITERLTAEYVLESLERLQKTAEENGQLANAIKAVELIGKTQKMFTDRMEISAKSYEDQLDEIPDLTMSKPVVLDVTPRIQAKQAKTLDSTDTGEEDK